MYIRVCIYVYVHKTYLHACVECFGGRMYFVQEMLIQPCEGRRSDKSGAMT